MKLTIKNAGEPHFGKYTCVAKNPRGQTDGSITLYGECPTLPVSVKMSRNIHCSYHLSLKFSIKSMDFWNGFV